MSAHDFTFPALEGGDINLAIFANRALLLVEVAAVVGLIALAVAMWVVAPAAGQARDDVRSISVSGEGTIRVEPDQAVLRFGVVSVADDPEEARRLNAEAASEAALHVLSVVDLVRLGVVVPLVPRLDHALVPVLGQPLQLLGCLRGVVHVQQRQGRRRAGANRT